MQLKDIEALTDTGPNRLLPLTPDLWAHAALLGASRRRKTGGSQRADRGRHNTHVDHMGAFGELLLLRLIRELDVDGAVLRHFQTHIYFADSAAPEGTPDLLFDGTDVGRRIGIDAKTFDCETNKHYFAINDGKHSALRGHCEAYFCALARPFGRWAAVSKLVPYADVDPAKAVFPQDEWFVGNLLSRGSPSRNLFLPTFLTKYFSIPPDLKNLRKKPYPRSEIMASVESAACQQALTEIIPALPMAEALDRVRAWNAEEDAKEAEKKAKERAKRQEQKAKKAAASA